MTEDEAPSRGEFSQLTKRVDGIQEDRQTERNRAKGEGPPSRSEFSDLSVRVVNIEHDQLSHEKICAERYALIRADFAGLRGTMKWVGALVTTVVLGALGWSLNNQWESSQQTLRLLTSTRHELTQHMDGGRGATSLQSE